ncbi:hypothetical protein QQS21_009786 [Conoideocrella luteorostrata]|uniref:Uncharacterized protein n=1 Tax=Conoideocrella luteorostrata TaxID=1105319 RepID=A0AAJ0FQ05_9HYPO|nr:hypothetical protein QQS21_009786 [Conoideocrella luteorostrata]
MGNENVIPSPHVDGYAEVLARKEQTPDGQEPRYESSSNFHLKPHEDDSDGLEPAGGRVWRRGVRNPDRKKSDDLEKARGKSLDEQALSWEKDSGDQEAADEKSLFEQGPPYKKDSGDQDLAGPKKLDDQEPADEESLYEGELSGEMDCDDQELPDEKDSEDHEPADEKSLDDQELLYEKNLDDQELADEKTFDHDLSTTDSSTQSSGSDSMATYEREVTGAPTLMTSMACLPKGQDPVADSSDSESVYTSDIPKSLKYMTHLVECLFKRWLTVLHDGNINSLCTDLPDLLCGFSLKIGTEHPSPSDQLHVMKFIHKRRREITKLFCEYKDERESLRRRKLEDRTAHDRVQGWNPDSKMDDPNKASDPPAEHDKSQGMNDDEHRDRDEAEDDEDNDPNLEMFESIVLNSAAYRCLLAQIEQEIRFTTLEAETMRKISEKILERLYCQPKSRELNSSKRHPIFTALFHSDWKPLAFALEQEYYGDPSTLMAGVITITEVSNGNAEAMVCSDYVCRTWPMLGGEFMTLVKQVVLSRPEVRCEVTLFDNTKCTAWIDSAGAFTLEVVGNAITVAEVGEMFSWITSAVQSAPDDKVAFVVPTLRYDPTSSLLDFKFDATQNGRDDVPPAAGQCWQDLFRNPVVVCGFPIRRRPSGCEAGLEFSLGLLAALMDGPRIVEFAGLVLLKASYGSRISSADPRVRKVVGDFDVRKHIPVSEFEHARHIVGWCKNVKNLTGSQSANYDVRRSSSNSPSTAFNIDRMTLTGVKFMSLGFQILLPKEKPIRKRTTCFYEKLLCMEQKFFLFYDTKDRRAWLVDGLSALLHLVRASLAYRRKLNYPIEFKDEDMIEADLQYTGKQAARSFLMNAHNLRLHIYKNPEKITEKSVLQPDGSTESTTESHTTWKDFADLVGDTCRTLDDIIAERMASTSRDGINFKFRTSLRRPLEGFEFMDVASGASEIKPKVALLQEIGAGWIDLVRSIEAIPLFGEGFGELLVPNTIPHSEVANGSDGIAPSHPASTSGIVSTLCKKWPRLPLGKDLLAVSTPDIEHIIEWKSTDPADKPLWELISNQYWWYCPDKAFEDCDCSTSPERQCDRVQVLLPTKLHQRFCKGLKSPPRPLPPHGAAIFGHATAVSHLWSAKLGSAPSELQL